MSRFVKLASGVDTSAVLLDLMRTPELWDQNTTRTTFEGTPFAACSDIWVRFRPASDLTSSEAHKTEYRCVNWPAWHALPSLRPLVRAIKQQVDPIEVGSILITRLPPSARMLPHSDCGSWAAEWYNTKVHAVLAGSAVAMCDGEEAMFRQGDLYSFDNLLMHSVSNRGTEDRIALIVSMRCEP